MRPTHDSTLVVPGLEGRVALTAGVLADTHLPFRLKRLPDEILQIFRGVDLILHAGDVDQIECLQLLTALAPMYAVRGNPHFKPTELSHGGMDLPVDLRFCLAGHSIIVNHGGWPDFWALASDWFWEKIFEPSRRQANPRIARRLLRMYPDADVIIFGHTHQPYQIRHGKTLLLNPGGVVPSGKYGPSVSKLHLTPQSVEAEIIPLSGGDSGTR